MQCSIQTDSVSNVSDKVLLPLYGLYLNNTVQKVLWPTPLVAIVLLKVVSTGMAMVIVTIPGRRPHFGRT